MEQEIAGSYPYDRIDYVPFNRDDHVEYWWKKNPQARSTLEQELNYYRTSIEIQARLLKQGLVDWIEFFPGSMGNEGQIDFDYYNGPPWGMGRLRPKSECVKNTKTLNQIALDAYREFYEDVADYVRAKLPGVKVGVTVTYGDTHRLIFALTTEEFAKTATGDPVTVQYGRGENPGERWDFGPLDKRLLDSDG